MKRFISTVVSLAVLTTFLSAGGIVSSASAAQQGSSYSFDFGDYTGYVLSDYSGVVGQTTSTPHATYTFSSTNGLGISVNSSTGLFYPAATKQINSVDIDSTPNLSFSVVRPDNNAANWDIEIVNANNTSEGFKLSELYIDDVSARWAGNTVNKTDTIDIKQMARNKGYTWQGTMDLKISFLAIRISGTDVTFKSASIMTSGKSIDLSQYSKFGLSWYNGSVSPKTTTDYATYIFQKGGLDISVNSTTNLFYPSAYTTMQINIDDTPYLNFNVAVPSANAANWDIKITNTANVSQTIALSEFYIDNAQDRWAGMSGSEVGSRNIKALAQSKGYDWSGIITLEINLLALRISGTDLSYKAITFSPSPTAVDFSEYTRFTLFSYSGTVGQTTNTDYASYNFSKSGLNIDVTDTGDIWYPDAILNLTDIRINETPYFNFSVDVPESNGSNWDIKLVNENNTDEYIRLCDIFVENPADRWAGIPGSKDGTVNIKQLAQDKGYNWSRNMSLQLVFQANGFGENVTFKSANFTRNPLVIPEKTAYIIDVSGLYNDNDRNELAMITALQGIVNREGAIIFLDPKLSSGLSQLGSTDHNYYPGSFDLSTKQQYESTEAFWIDYYSKNHNYQFQNLTISEAISMFSGSFNGLVKFDSNSATSAALSVAGIDTLLPATEELIVKYPSLSQLSVQVDLTNKGFQNKYDAQQWVINNKLASASKEIVGSYFNSYYENGMIQNDYVVQNGGIVYDLNSQSSVNGTGLPSIEPDNTMLNTIYGNMNKMGIVYGWGDPDESEFVKHASAYGLTVLLGNMGNGSFYSKVDALNEDNLVQDNISNDDLIAPYINQSTNKVNNKIYIAFETNEGDSYKAAASLMNFGSWLHKDRGSMPISWGIDTALFNLFPSMMEYYANSMTANDSFFNATSGYGYTHPSAFGIADPSTKDSLISQYQSLVKANSNKYCINAIDIWWPTSNISSWVSNMGLSGLTLWSDYNKASMQSNVPVINSEFYYYIEDAKAKCQETQIPQVIAQYMNSQSSSIPSNLPFFMTFYGGDPAYFKAIKDNLSSRFEVVSIDALNALAKKALADNPQIANININSNWSSYLSNIPTGIPTYNLTSPIDIYAVAGPSSNIKLNEASAYSGTKDGAGTYLFDSNGLSLSPRGYFTLASTIEKPIDLNTISGFTVNVSSNSSNKYLFKINFNGQQIWQTEAKTSKDNPSSSYQIPQSVLNSISNKVGKISIQLVIDNVVDDNPVTFNSFVFNAS